MDKDNFLIKGFLESPNHYLKGGQDGQCLLINGGGIIYGTI